MHDGAFEGGGKAGLGSNEHGEEKEGRGLPAPVFHEFSSMSVPLKHGLTPFRTEVETELEPWPESCPIRLDGGQGNDKGIDLVDLTPLWTSICRE